MKREPRLRPGKVRLASMAEYCTSGATHQSVVAIVDYHRSRSVRQGLTMQTLLPPLNYHVMFGRPSCICAI
jgi:hypothetical protein